MIKKKSNQQQIISPKFKAQQNTGRNVDLKPFSSPNRKQSVVNSKVKFGNKSPSSGQYLGLEAQKQPGKATLSSRNKSKVNNGINNEPLGGGKQIKKATSPISPSESIKRFSKTSKIPTLKSSTIELIQKQEIEMQKLSKNLQKSQQKQDNKSQISILTLKQEIITLKAINEELKKQNQKLNKKLQKLKSLNDDNKKILKERIQNFNSEGDILRKFKQQISDLMKTVQGLKQNVTKLQGENKLLKSHTQKLPSAKQQKQIQTYIIETDKNNLEMGRNQDFNIESIKQLSDKNYYSSSSRRSYGGILPLQTVYNLNESIKVNFRTAQSTPKKIFQDNEKLLKKYDNYWSVKLIKSEDIQNLNEFSCQNNLQVKQKCPNIQKEQQLNLQSKNSQNKNMQISQKIKDLSPDILIQKYQKISQQQQLIDSLYKIINELSIQIQQVQKTKIKLEKVNEDFHVTIQKFKQQNQQLKRKIQQYMGTSLEFNLNNNIKTNNKIFELLNNEINEQTLLLDETRDQKIIITKNQMTTIINYEKEKQKQKFQPRSAVERRPINDFDIIDEISQFFNSDVIICHYSRNQHQFFDYQQILLNTNHLIEDTNKIDQKDIHIDREIRLNKEKSLLRIEDSLEALQYFSSHTPQNISSQVSCLGINLCQQMIDGNNYSNKIEDKHNVTQ